MVERLNSAGSMTTPDSIDNNCRFGTPLVLVNKTSQYSDELQRSVEKERNENRKRIWNGRSDNMENKRVQSHTLV